MPSRARVAGEVDVVDADDWIVVADDRSIARGWGAALFEKQRHGASSESSHHRRLDRALVRRGLAKTSGEAKKMITEGRVLVSGVMATRVEQRVALEDVSVERGTA
ncbi:RNA-binding S4 domain [Ostreococcus tauri]|uniref:RNA-binding S4 domain n=2 Tax=Ostreococcus tauri TaxID=70448 RepID=A0A090M3J1_OSTTA|nr:RNA-binding S4 domain [Ostreococcus tauri]CEF97247.1 RNA-binding S4 domain [Ostreococcus tauri]|eukprot:XP_003078326.2 RNA-binding S4 domain [Ostreococcus tauri]